MTIDNIIQTSKITSLPFTVVSLRNTLKRDTERAKHLSMQRNNRWTWMLSLPIIYRRKIVMQKYSTPSCLQNNMTIYKTSMNTSVNEIVMYIRNWLCFLKINVFDHCHTVDNIKWNSKKPSQFLKVDIQSTCFLQKDSHMMY